MTNTKWIVKGRWRWRPSWLLIGGMNLGLAIAGRSPWFSLGVAIAVLVPYPGRD